MLLRTLSPRLALGMFAALATLSACGGEDPQAAATPEERPILLGEQDVAHAATAELGSAVVISGSLQPAYSARVKVQVPGTVASIMVDRGSRVAEGQTLATIEAAGIRGQAEGARASVAAANAQLALARQRLESARTLRDAGAMSALDFQAAEAAYEAAEAQVAMARAQATGAEEQAGRATVRSPIAGVVGERLIEPGEVVSPGDEVFTVIRSDVLELSGEVPVDAAAQIRPGQEVVFTLPAYPLRDFRGEVARIEPMANVETRQVGVYLRMPNPGNVIAGQFATGRVMGGDVVEAVVVPEGAVRGSEADRFVLVIEQGRAVRRPVTLGATDPATGSVAVASGLSAGEQVITAPSAAIEEGARVEVAAPSAPRPAGATEGTQEDGL